MLMQVQIQLWLRLRLQLQLRFVAVTILAAVNDCEGMLVSRFHFKMPPASLQGEKERR